MSKRAKSVFTLYILKGGCNIFKEIRKYRGSSRQCSSRIDDEVGVSDIAGHFAQIYGNLYNRSEHDDAFEEMCDKVSADLDESSHDSIERIDEELVWKALKMMKSSKRDAQFDLQSDCFIKGPPELVYHLTKLLKSFIIHGTVPNILLLCTLIPLVKDNLGYNFIC